MVYNQNIVIKLPERDDATYTANFRYNIKPESKDRASSLTTNSFNDFDSVCSETMVGLKLTDSKFSQCWFGRQDEPLTDEVVEVEDDKAVLVLAQTGSTKLSSDFHSTELAQTKTSSAVRKGNTFAQMS